MITLEMQQRMAKLGESLFSRGYSVGGAGNMSARLAGGNVLATPTNSCLGRLVPENLSVVGADGTLLQGAPPTKELPLHLALYHAKPECRAVVHLHSTYATALSCLAGLDPADALRPFTPYYVMKIGKLPIIAYYRPGSPELGRDIAAKAPSHSAFLLANHGAVVCGANIEDAVNNAEELEETAKLYFLLLSSGKEVQYLSGDQIAALRNTQR